MPRLRTWLRRPCAPGRPRPRLAVRPLEDRVTPAVGDLVHTLVPPGGAFNFGTDLAASDQYVAVGSSRDSVGNVSQTGAVHLYSATTGAFLRTIPNPTPVQYDQFGEAVALAGDLLVVGALGHDSATINDVGAAYLFRASTGELLHTFDNPTPTNSIIEHFGYTVGLVGDTVLIGAYLDDSFDLYAGSVYRFSATTGLLLGKLEAPTPEGGDYFGYSIAVGGGRVAIGAALDEVPGPFTNSGGVHLYDATTLEFERSIYNPAPDQLDFFGNTVALSGNNLVVGAFNGDVTGNDNVGTAYVYNAATGALVRTLNNPTPALDDRFGDVVAVAGDTVLVGAPYDDTQVVDNGSAYVFDAPSGALLDTIGNPVTGESAQFGMGVAASGARLYVGANIASAAYEFEGRGGAANPPEANDDTFNNVAEDAANVALDVLANDTAAVPSALRITGVTQPSHGSVAIAADGKSVRYTPAADYNGPDTFTYTVTDPNGTDTASVSLTVTPLNDPPTATDDTADVPEDAGPTAIPVLGNDSFAPDTGETLTITAVTQGQHGSVVITGGGTGLTYQPAANYAGPDSFTYTISDGNGPTDTATVDVAVASVNDPPTAGDDTADIPRDAGPTSIPVLGNDSFLPDSGETLTIAAVTQGAHGSVVITGGGTGLTYQPAANYAGPDSFTYTISDGNGGTDTAAVTVAVLAPPPNNPPTAVVDTATLAEDVGPTTIGVLANDSTAPDTGETLTVQSVTTPAHGSAAVAPDGKSVTYTPHPDFAGTDTFYYVINDGRGAVASTAVVVTVTNDGTDRLEAVPSAGALDFLEKRDTSLPLDGGLTVGTAAGDLVTRAVIKFASGYVKGRDQLAFAPQGVLRGKFSAATGTLTITGKAPPAVYQAALRTVQFLNRSADPVGGPRTVSIALFDAAGAGDPANRAVHVTAVNDGPTIVLPQATVAARIGKPAAVLAGLQLTDPDTALLRGATVRITTPQSGDELRINGLLTGSASGIGFSYANGTLTLTGTASLATYLKVLKLVKFTGTAGGLRILEVTADDGLVAGPPATRLVSVG